MPQNLFLRSTDLLAHSDDPLNYINYQNLEQEHKEFMRSDLWDLEFLTSPRAVYFPGNPLIKARLASVSPSFTGEITQLNAIVRQFYIHQAVRSQQSNGSMSLHFVDREDQAIAAFLWDWQQKIGSLEDRYAFRKEDTICTIKLTHFNVSRKPIAKWVCYGCQLASGAIETLNRQFSSDDASIIGEWDATINFEHYDYELLNL
jgi:hypothetical protein